MIKEHVAEYAANIRSALTGTAQAYWMNAPENHTFPYAVFEIRSAYGGKVIDFDVWGSEEVATSELADAIEECLDGYIIANSYHTSIITSNYNKQFIADVDERIIHVNLSFTATYKS